MRRHAGFIALIAGVLWLLSPIRVCAETKQSVESSRDVEGAESQTRLAAGTLETLASFVDLRNALLADIKVTIEKVGASQSDSEKKDLKLQLDKLESELRAVTRNFENIAAGVDITAMREEKEEDLNFQRELLALLKPALDEMKEMTSHVRQKSDLKDKISTFEESLPVVDQAIANVERPVGQSKDESVTQALTATLDKWRRQETFMQSELQAGQLQLEELISTEVSIAQASNSSLDLAVIADFRGELGDLYNRLRRAIQRWCVDACTEYD